MVWTTQRRTRSSRLMEIDNEKLFHLILTAKYLDVKGILNVSCKKVALMAKGKSPEELKVIYGIPTDKEDEDAAKVARLSETSKVQSKTFRMNHSF
uniref:Skp1 domain-containing protein n=1 Tax=Caenorhabditis tropicalis TaxID=1561998 RepID=A0A1I7U2W4_9PELO